MRWRREPGVWRGVGWSLHSSTHFCVSSGESPTSEWVYLYTLLSPPPASGERLPGRAAAAAAALSVPTSGMVCPMPPVLTMPLAPTYIDNGTVPPPGPETGAFMCIQCGKAFKEHAELVAHDLTCKVSQNPSLALACDR